MTIPLVPALLTGSSNLPGSFRRAVLGASLFGLAPRGVLPATSVARSAVRSYRTFSPLPPDSPRRGESGGGIFSVPLVRRVAPPGSYPARCPAEFGLSSPTGTSSTLALDVSASSFGEMVTHGSGHPANCNISLSHGGIRRRTCGG